MPSDTMILRSEPSMYDRSIFGLDPADAEIPEPDYRSVRNFESNLILRYETHPNPTTI